MSIIKKFVFTFLFFIIPITFSLADVKKVGKYKDWETLNMCVFQVYTHTQRRLQVNCTKNRLFCSYNMLLLLLFIVANKTKKCK